MEHILVIDTGSSSMRGILINEEGKIIVRHHIKHSMKTLEGGIAVQAAEDFRNGLITICKSIGMKGHCISALAFTSQRSSVLPVDEAGKPLSDILMWHDKRSSKLCDEVNQTSAKALYQICGMKASPVFSAPKMLWLKQNQPELYQKAHKLLGIHDYLLFLSTGKFMTDTSLASRTCLLDIHKRQWSPELLKLFEIDEEKLCTLIPVGQVVGKLTADFSALTGLREGIPVVSAGGDQQCSALGQGLGYIAEAGITSGTASYVVSIVDKPILDEKLRVNVNIAAEEDKYILEASNMASGAVYRWFKEIMYSQEVDFKQMNEEIQRSNPGARGVIMLPDLAGCGCPHWDPMARGMFFNLGFETERSDMLRAVLEGIGAEITECIDTLVTLTPDIKYLRSTGGLAKFRLFSQIIADMTNRPVEICNQKETTALGAWVVAATTLGIFKSKKEALAKLAQEETCNKILQPNVRDHELYAKQKEARKYIRSCINSAELARILH